MSCTRCGRSGHTIEKCYANSHVNGYSLKNTNEPKVEIKDDINDSSDDNVICSRCGCLGHPREDCFASYHIKGYLIK